MRTLTIGLVATLAFAMMPPASAATPTKVLDDPKADEISVAASVSYFAWSSNSSSRSSQFNTYVRPTGGGARTRVNPKGTKSFSVGIDGSTVVYQESSNGQDDLRLYNAATGARPPIPDGVNTKQAEYRPSLSGRWLLFSRTDPDTGSTKAILFNLVTESERVLAHTKDYLVTDQVNGDWATFERCQLDHGRFVNCNVFRYQISTKTLTRIPNPDRQQYAGGVSQDGTVYFMRTGGSDVWRCGHHSKIIRYPVGGPGVVIAKLPAGIDAYVTFATDEAPASTTVYLQRVNCQSQGSGIYRIANADTAT